MGGVGGRGGWGAEPGGAVQRSVRAALEFGNRPGLHPGSARVDTPIPMRVVRNANVFAPEKFEDNRRRTGRVRCTMLMCDLGDVNDFSCGGMRVLSRMKPKFKEGESGLVTLSWPAGQVVLNCTVVRRRKLGVLRWELGLQFEELTPEQRTIINEAARFGAASECIKGIGCNKEAA